MAEPMYRDFQHCRAWTDAMYDRGRYVGLIEFQPRQHGAAVTLLWVFAPGSTSESEAERAAWRMLEHVHDISADGQVWFDDGVAL